MMMATINDVLDFWLNRVGPQGWWTASDEVDAECSALFGEATITASKGELDGWAETSDGALALLILLDQFPRNIYRNDPRAFGSDAQAREVARKSIAANVDLEHPEPQRMFFYMPFEHSEMMADQDWCLALFCARMPGLSENTMHHVIKHREMIERFGRFPHRNAVLGREATPEEIAFLSGADAYIPGAKP